MKTCTKCGETKPVSEYSKNANKRSGLQAHCKSCCNVRSSLWRAANPDYGRLAVSAWRRANPDKAKLIKERYLCANIEKTKKYFADYREKNLGKLKARDQNRRARKAANGGRLSAGLAARLYKLQRGKCACCGKPLGDDYHLDHVMPLALGGANTDDNIQLLRSKCNLQKKEKHPVDFMRQRGFLL